MHFLLHLQLQATEHSPSAELVSLAARMFTLVIETVLLKDSLAYSGTTLEWKVVYFGLAAAGILCLSLLRQKQAPATSPPLPPAAQAQVIQDLNVLVALVDTGVFIHPIDPNYALLSRATLTIKSLLRRLLAKDDHTRVLAASSAALDAEPQGAVQTVGPLGAAAWHGWENHQHLQDFEVEFWLNLAEHPFLTGTPVGGVEGV